MDESLRPRPGLMSANQICLFLDVDGTLIDFFAGASRELPEALLVNPFDVTENGGRRRGCP